LFERRHDRTQRPRPCPQKASGNIASSWILWRVADRQLHRVPCTWLTFTCGSRRIMSGSSAGSSSTVSAT
jgi:hypothetical protein